MSIPHHPLCGVFDMSKGYCDSDCAKHKGDESWVHPPTSALWKNPSIGFRMETATGIDPAMPGTEELVPVPFDPLTHAEREAMIARLIAYHENSFARLAMDQAQLLLDDNPDRPAMDALNRALGRHAAILAELRR